MTISPVIRKAVITDADGILQIENSCFSLPHTKEQLLYEIASSTDLILVAGGDGGEVQGFVTMRYVIDEGYIGDVAVDERYRRCGIADSLLSALKQHATDLGLTFITLEVRESNLPAIALYEKNGYKKISVMKDYYTLPKENAIIMTLNF